VEGGFRAIRSGSLIARQCHQFGIGAARSYLVCISTQTHCSGTLDSYPGPRVGSHIDSSSDVKISLDWNRNQHTGCDYEQHACGKHSDQLP